MPKLQLRIEEKDWRPECLNRQLDFYHNAMQLIS